MYRLLVLLTICHSIVQCSAQDGSQTSPTCTAPNVPMKTITFNYDDTRMVMVKKGDAPGSMEHAAPEGILYNICRGISAITGAFSQNITLHAADKDTRAQNRNWCGTGKDSACIRKKIKDNTDDYISSDMPASAKKAIRAADDMTCHEFPFARTMEASIPYARGVAMCVPRIDTGWQGRIMSDYFCQDPQNCGDDKIHDGCPFSVEIVGWDCAMQQQMPGKRKRDTTVRTQSAMVGDNLYHNFSTITPGLNMLSMPLGNLARGLHLIDLESDPGSFNQTVVSYDGNIYPLVRVNDTRSNFTLSGDTDDLILVGTTFDTTVNATYSITRADGGQLITSAGSRPEVPSLDSVVFLAAALSIMMALC